MKKPLLIISRIISITSLLLCGCAGDDTDYATVTDANFTNMLSVVTVTHNYLYRSHNSR